MKYIIMNFNKKQKIIWASGIVLLAVTVALLLCLNHWLDKRRRNAEMIQNTIMYPQNIEPEKFLDAIDKSFRSLGKKEKRALLKDRRQAEKYVAEATRKELKKSFQMLFCLPAPVRKKIIKTSAKRLLNIAKKNPQKVTSTFSSSGGRGALKGASIFFLLNLSGKEKAEVAPLTAAMYEIVRQQSKGIKLKNIK